jgi:alginate production protein
MKTTKFIKQVGDRHARCRTIVTSTMFWAMCTGAYGVELAMVAENEALKPAVNAPQNPWLVAQFQLPQTRPANQGSPGNPADAPAAAPPLIQQLTYQFSYGSESDITYRRNPDLDRFLRDNFLLMAPQVNGSIIYRPSSSVEMMLEVLVEREVAVKEERIVTLPTGQTQVAPRRRGNLAVDQAWVAFKGLLGPVDLTVGRRNFEDDRHWLYDTSLDSALLRFKQGAWQTDFSVSRKDRLDLDLLAPIQKIPIDNYMLYVDYRGIEDTKLAGYTIFREDKTGAQGRPLHFGVRAYGTPSNRFNYWSEFSLLRGKDELKKSFRGRAYDVGGTYRFTGVRFAPSITLGYAHGSGDDNPNDGKNYEFRQTGLHSNEARLGGIPKVRYYGEALDPDLSNLRIFTAAVGFRPAPTMTVDLVYHHYRLNKIADEIRNSAVTAQMNQDDSSLSKNAGRGLDIVLGFRNLFGVRRLGLDLRAGLFLPGKAFRNENIGSDPTTFRKADKAVSAIMKFWY